MVYKLKSQHFASAKHNEDRVVHIAVEKESVKNGHAWHNFLKLMKPHKNEMTIDLAQKGQMEVN